MLAWIIVNCMWCHYGRGYGDVVMGVGNSDGDVLGLIRFLSSIILCDFSVLLLLTESF